MKNIEDIRLFFYTLSHMNWCPHDNFHSYLSPEGQRIYSPEEAQNLNRLMAESFYLCGELGIDIYELSKEYQNVPPEQMTKGNIVSFDYKVFSWQ